MVQAEAGDAHVASFGPTATNLAAAAAPARCACAFMHAPCDRLHTYVCMAAFAHLHAWLPAHTCMQGRLCALVCMVNCTRLPVHLSRPLVESLRICCRHMEGGMCALQQGPRSL